MEPENKTPMEPENKISEEEKKPSVGALVGGFFFTFMLSAPFALPILFWTMVLVVGTFGAGEQIGAGVVCLIVFLVVLVGWIFILRYFTKKFAINKPRVTIGDDPTKPDDGKLEGTYETRSYTVNKGKGPAFERTYTTINKKK